MLNESRYRLRGVSLPPSRRMKDIAQFWHGVIFVNAYDADNMGFLSAERLLLGRRAANEDTVVVDAWAGFVRDDAGYSAFGFFDCFADAPGTGFLIRG